MSATGLTSLDYMINEAIYFPLFTFVPDQARKEGVSVREGMCNNVCVYDVLHADCSWDLETGEGWLFAY